MPSTDQILRVASQSAIARHNWPDRGVAPLAYIKGMALVYARMVCKFEAGDAAALEMAKANTGDDERDALSWYSDQFSAAGMTNDAAGINTLRHLFVLLIGLGMRESSGKHCEGRDQSAHNITAETAEAGLFQTSFNARTAHPLLPQILARYRAGNDTGFVDIFRQNVHCTDRDLENFGNGDGAEFQRLSKACPAFATEFAAVGLRNIRHHWGPINRKEAEIRPECDEMLQQVQAIVEATPDICGALQSGEVADPEPVVAILRRGAEGDDVTRLQEALRSKGFMIDADGVFGEETENAVRRFQEANGLPADGAAGLERLERQPNRGAHPTIRLLAQVRLGIETADMLAHEAFSRRLRDRRAVARYRRPGRERGAPPGERSGPGGQRPRAPRHDPVGLALSDVLAPWRNGTSPHSRRARRHPQGADHSAGGDELKSRDL
jgi:hypothetical protein